MIYEYDVYTENEINVNLTVFDDPSYQVFFNKWREDMKVLDIQKKKKRIESLLAHNHRLMSIIVELKRELATKAENESMYKNIWILNSGIESLENIRFQGKIF